WATLFVTGWIRGSKGRDMTNTAQISSGGSPLLEVTDLSVTFGSGDDAIQVTHGVGFTIERKQTVALVGESGSGKSVSAMSIIGLLPDNAKATGSVRYEGRELIGMLENELNKIR